MAGEHGTQHSIDRTVLAYGGGAAASAAIPWLARTHGADVIAMILDIGQQQPVEQLRALALACGAARAHVIDARDEFARLCVLPAVDGADRGTGSALAHPIIARQLVELAAIEGAAAVAHASSSASLTQLIGEAGPGLRVIAPARAWDMTPERLAAYARDRGIPSGGSASGGARERHLLMRPVVDPSRAPEGDARVELTFEGRVPTAINGVTMSAAELIESLSLIAGQYGVGWQEPVPAPGAIVLRSAYAALPAADGVVTLKLARGGHVVLAPGAQMVGA